MASLAVDIYASEVGQCLNRLLLSGLLSLAVSCALAILFSSILSRRVSRPLTSLCGTLGKIGEGDLNTVADVSSRDEFGDVARAVNEMTHGLRQRELLKGTVARYLSSQMAEKILSSGRMPDLTGERRKITVIFCDIRGFTHMAEQMQPEEVVAILNEYFAAMVDAIYRCDGLLDKFLGDGLMALFGAFDESPEHQEQSTIEAALLMKKVLVKVQSKIPHKHDVQLRIGIGIHTDPAVVGNVGSTQRMEFTAIGDTVNVASGLEEATKQLGEAIVVSRDTWQAGKEKFKFRELAPMHIKGRDAPVDLFALDRPIEFSD